MSSKTTTRRQKHYNIPIFIPEEGCRFQCVFCNQRNISGHQKIPTPEEVEKIILSILQTLKTGAEIEVAFFGGNFTGLPVSRQKELLNAARKFYDAGYISGIRLSTRPDYICEEGLSLLSDYPVKTIELGVQSFSDHVLQRSGRGHNADQNRKASQMIKNYGFKLVLQMMTGLPASTYQDEMKTAEEIIGLQAEATRIYPCLVIKNTQLEQLYLAGKYNPQSLIEAAQTVAQLIIRFEAANIKILRVGLHPSEGLSNGSALVAGPWHPAFRDIAETFIWQEIFKLNIPHDKYGKHLTLCVPTKALSAASGYKQYNKNWLLQLFKSVRFVGNPVLKNREFSCDFS